jgi:hypothetical protein
MGVRSVPAVSLGPEDLSFDEMAAIMTDVLGKRLRFQSVPGEAFKAQLKKFGASEAFAQSLVDMHAATDLGGCQPLFKPGSLEGSSRSLPSLFGGSGPCWVWAARSG